MKRFLHLGFWLCLGSLSWAQEAEHPVPEESQSSKDAWLGIKLAKPDETTATHVPALPPGIGFVVVYLVKDGPAKVAGMEKLDLLWKLDDQLLVNEGQLATLLRLADPGDEVTVSLFREGKPLELKVKLGESKHADRALIRSELNEAVMRSEDGALRIVNLEKKTASISNERGSAEVTRQEDGDSVRILDLEGNTIYEGVLRGEPKLSAVPKAWRRQVWVMRRSLDHALSAKAAPQRKPRPRVILPNPKDQPDGESKAEKKK